MSGSAAVNMMASDQTGISFLTISYSEDPGLLNPC